MQQTSNTYAKYCKYTPLVVGVNVVSVHCQLGIIIGVSAVMSKVLLQEIETIIIMQTLVGL